MRALERANEVRFARARVKRGIKAGGLSVADAMRLDAVAGMRVYDVLRAQRGWGCRKRAAKGARALNLLGGLGINPYRPVGELTDRQRGLIVEALS